MGIEINISECMGNTAHSMRIIRGDCMRFFFLIFLIFNSLAMASSPPIDELRNIIPIIPSIESEMFIDQRTTEEILRQEEFEAELGEFQRLVTIFMEFGLVQLNQETGLPNITEEDYLYMKKIDLLGYLDPDSETQIIELTEDEQHYFMILNERGHLEIDPETNEFISSREEIDNALNDYLEEIEGEAPRSCFIVENGERFESHKQILIGFSQRCRHKQIRIPFYVDIIGDNVFAGRGITKVTLPLQLERIGNYAFANNEITSISIYAHLREIGNGAFLNNQISEIRFYRNRHVHRSGYRLSRIGAWAFMGNQITSLELPYRSMTIAEQAFADNQISHLVLPIMRADDERHRVRIGPQAFIDNQIESVYVHRFWFSRAAVNVFDYDVQYEYSPYLN